MTDKEIIKKVKEWFDMYPPEYGSIEEWNIIDKINKLKYPKRYWIAETLIPNTWWPITRTYNKIVSYIRFGFFEKLHLIDTKLPHDYQEVDTRLLHGSFSLLVDFVEIEKAWMQAIFSENYKRPWWKLDSRFRDRELGLKYLDWEITLINSEYSDLQGINAKIIKELYLWWVDSRPNRIEPYSIMEDIPEDSTGRKDWFGKKDPNRTETYKIIDKLETDYFNEDTLMLKKLVSIRASLWT
jgi:hypothetical protein